MKKTITINLGFVIALIVLAAFGAGYGLAFSQITFGWSEIIVATIVGALMATVGAVVSSSITRDSTIKGVKLSHDLELQRSQKENMRIIVDEAITATVKFEGRVYTIQHSANDLFSRSSEYPDFSNFEDAAYELQAMYSASFPETMTFCNSFIRDLHDAIYNLKEICNEPGEDRVARVSEIASITLRLLAYTHLLKFYILGIYKAGIEVPVPDKDRLEEILNDEPSSNNQ